MSVLHKMMFVTSRLQLWHTPSIETEPARTSLSEPVHKIQDVLCSYGTPNLNCVSRSTLLYQGSQ